MSLDLMDVPDNVGSFPFRSRFSVSPDDISDLDLAGLLQCHESISDRIDMDYRLDDTVFECDVSDTVYFTILAIERFFAEVFDPQLKDSGPVVFVNSDDVLVLGLSEQIEHSRCGPLDDVSAA